MSERRKFIVGVAAGAVGASMPKGALAGMSNFNSASNREQRKKIKELYDEYLLAHRHKNSKDTNISGVEHSFFESETIRFGAMPGCVLIMQHEHSIPIEGWEKFTGPVNLLPIYVARKRAGLELSRADLKDMLTGSINNWEEIGAPPGEILIGVSGHEFEPFKDRRLDRYAIALASLGIPRIELFQNMRVFPDYERLADFGRKEPNSILIGLRGVDTSDLSTVSIDREPFSLEPSSNYPLKFDTTLSVRRSKKGYLALKSYISIVTKPEPGEQTLG